MKNTFNFILASLIAVCISCGNPSFVINKNEIPSTAIILPDSANRIDEDLVDYVTDRYVYLWNAILKEELRLNDGINTYFLDWARLYRLTTRIDEFYSLADFDTTDSYLEKALQKNISEQARSYIQRMQIANQHSRLTFISFMAGKGVDRADMVKKANDLIGFRIKNKNKMDLHWNYLFWCQHYHMRDQIGTRNLGFLPKELDTREF